LFDLFEFIVAMTRAKRNLVSLVPISVATESEEHKQCVIGDSSTVRHGSRFLRKWVEWLEMKADVRYAGME
jgi:hypothetical protein